MNARQFESKFTKLSHFLEDIVECGSVSDVYDVSTHQQSEIELLLMHDIDSDELQEIVEQSSDIISSMAKGESRKNQTIENYIKEQLFEAYFEEIREYIYYLVDKFSPSFQDDDYDYDEYSLREVVGVAC